MTAPLPAGGSVAPMIKGAGIRSFFGWYAANFGQQRLTEIVDSLGEEHRQLLKPQEPELGVLASSWYPAPLIHTVLDRLLEGRTEAEVTELVQAGAEATIRETLTGLYRLLFKAMMTPERYAQRAQLLFSRYFNSGIMTKTAPDPCSHLSVVRDWGSHHPFLCEMLLYTGVYVYRELGCCNVAMERTACVSQGDEECSFLITWESLDRKRSA